MSGAGMRAGGRCGAGHLTIVLAAFWRCRVLTQCWRAISQKTKLFLSSLVIVDGALSLSKSAESGLVGCWLASWSLAAGIQAKTVQC